MHVTGSKAWLITGSSRGLGRAFAQAALEAGHRVVATARNPLQLNDIVSRYGDRVRVLALDVTSETQAQHAIDTAIETFGCLDVLVNNTGYGFHTDFAGISTDLREGRPEYDATVGATVRFQRDYDGKQPGDPAKAAAALLHIATLSDPPLRLFLGSDSYNAAEQAALQKLELDRKWKDLSISTDYASDDFSA